MSSEILAKRPIFPKRIAVVSRKQRTVGGLTQRIQLEMPQYNALHDLEAFFWVLVWLYMSRDGPATRRVELLTESLDSSHLRTAFVDLFEADDGGLVNKESVFLAKMHLEATVLPNMSGYLNSLSKNSTTFLQPPTRVATTKVYTIRSLMPLMQQKRLLWSCHQTSLMHIVPWSRWNRSEGARIGGVTGTSTHLQPKALRRPSESRMLRVLRGMTSLSLLHPRNVGNN